ncbi:MULTISPECIES: alternative ribosome rescue aminoacyl-tRNA hydrolase ArfB [Chryseobacterium]|uniref:Ribosome-associated protein n=1 Tax=Chryseobacterium camelliae TaxID=1265445 RepID=A0ABU0TKE9_9FLAO|nr:MULTISPECIES: alternative ribosome rescue aminoacyl-tRNA hydrolase ArfB [Chryseobacterium]MDT3408616.1 ribosome-associated protein [Pseudacidovorax intermedius]MDQ1097529.1 ribosome-associated protein [Chryseobacterium camelliae]MDQ1101458.1 ribosome-associated protein [Chryseobacterium sp. SORGH_AS_1048]MDR6084902.1 ribosome-associated protein [Chryseobacterium sp. SORGH_AS_0909]MDR6129254.1 ribosome-associated protein [Chryseobacterium sp. SORGH_AS_1175]
MRDFSKELQFKTSRSSGAGGQNVNKVETSVTVLWNVSGSAFFNDAQKALISDKLRNRINAEGMLFLTVSESRTQLMNKNKAIEKIMEVVDKALIVPKKRFATKPSKGQKQKRLDTKKKISEKKENRRFKF